MTTDMRKSGMDVVGDMAWGTHCCLFYETKADLLDTLVSYCKAGLDSQEFCLWVIAAPVTQEDAIQALRRAVPDIDRHLDGGSIEIVAARDWYLQDDTFNLERVIHGWTEKLARAMASGYTGVRVTGDTAWLERKDWKNFCDYEESLNVAIANQRLAVLCTYPLDACGAGEVLDVVRTHQFAIAKRRGDWDVIETAGHKQAKAEIKRLNEELLASQAAISLENTRLNRDLEGREARIRRLVEANIIGICIWNVDGRIIEANEAFLRMVQYGRDDLVSGRLGWADLTPVEWREGDTRASAELEATGTLQPYEKECFRKDGGRVPVLVGAAAFEDNRDEGVAFVIDLSELKRTEEALRHTQAYLAEAQRLTHTGSFACNVASRDIIYSSDEHCRLFGFNPGKGTPSFEDFVQRTHPEDRGRVIDLLETASLSATDVDTHFRVVLPDGTTRYLHGVGHPVVKPSGDAGEFVGILIDVTERRRADEERERLRQVQADLAYLSRVTTMGELTASLAHEIRQPITAAMTNAKTCLRWLGRDEPDLEEGREAAARVVKDVTRAADIISSISVLFKKGAMPRELVDANQLIREMIGMLRSEANRHSISIRTELDPELPQVIAERVQLQQVFMNLMLNGIDAMKETSGGNELTIRSEAGNGQLLFSVIDTGAGLLPEQLDQIFKAFFTTKDQGTGMGLPISRSIVESHGGRLWAIRNAGRGATLQFNLPAVVAGAHA